MMLKHCYACVQKIHTAQGCVLIQYKSDILIFGDSKTVSNTVTAFWLTDALKNRAHFGVLISYTKCNIIRPSVHTIPYLFTGSCSIPISYHITGATSRLFSVY